MPMYDFKCVDCGSVTSRFRKIKDRHDKLLCDCDGAMQLAILVAPAGVVQPECHYVCPATGRQITNRGQRANTFAEFDLEAANPDQQDELMQRRMKKKSERDKIAKDYLPGDLKDKIAKIGQNSDMGFVS